MPDNKGKKQAQMPAADIEKAVDELIAEYNKHYENAVKEMEAILKKAGETEVSGKYLEPTLSLLRSFFVEGIQVGEQVIDAITEMHLKQMQLNREFAERCRELVSSYWGKQNQQLQEHISKVLDEWLNVSARMLSEAVSLTVRSYINSLNFAFCVPRLAQPLLEAQINIFSEYFRTLSNAWEELRIKFSAQKD